MLLLTIDSKLGKRICACVGDVRNQFIVLIIPKRSEFRFKAITKLKNLSRSLFNREKMPIMLSKLPNLCQEKPSNQMWPRLMANANLGVNRSKQYEKLIGHFPMGRMPLGISP